MTPTHLLLNWALFGSPKETQRERLSIIFGALMPDIGVWIFALWFFLSYGVHFGELWELYYRDPYINVWFNLLHSLVLWPLLTFIGYAYQKRLLMLFAGSATVHAICDFFVHANDAYANFIPFTVWRFHSPLSYWDPAHYGQFGGIIDMSVALIALSIVYKRITTRPLRIGLIGVGILLVSLLGIRLYALLPLS